MLATECAKRLPAATAALVLMLCVSTASAQEWAKAMFDHTTHNFGVVARGAKVEHRFNIENIYEEDLHIQSVSSSCGCSTPQVNRRLLKTWEKAEVLVTVDTRDFLGRKEATIKVVFDQPYPGEVQLHVYSYIRSDIVVQPGDVSFGSVMQGAGATQTVSVSYAGRDDWRITKVQCANPSIVPSFTETSRTPGKAAYSLSVTLKPDTPPGYLRDQLVLVTNDYDTRAAHVPVAIEGLVVSALSVQPSLLFLGVADVGRPLSGNLVLQGRAPFQITAVHSSDERFQCKLPIGSKSAHILPVTFSVASGDAAGQTVKAKISIETDVPGAAVVEATVSARIAAPADAP